MKSLKLMTLAAMTTLLAAEGTVLAQAEAPQPAPSRVMGVKMTEPQLVLQTTFTSGPTAEEQGRAIREAAEVVFTAAADARVNILPNHVAITVLNTMDELMAGAVAERRWRFQLPVIDELAVGQFRQHADIEVARAEAEFVAYTYSVGPEEVALDEGVTSLMRWVTERGHTPLGPFHIRLFQNPDEADPAEIVWEVQVGIKGVEE